MPRILALAAGGIAADLLMISALGGGCTVHCALCTVHQLQVHWVLVQCAVCTPPSKCQGIAPVVHTLITSYPSSLHQSTQLNHHDCQL